MSTKEINFYQFDDTISKSMAPLLLKITDEKNKALILSKNPAIFKEIDDGLWQFGKYRFIAHCTIYEKDIEKISSFSRQPIVITDEENNVNHSQYLIIHERISINFLKNFRKIFFFYDSASYQQAISFKKDLDDILKVNSYKKIDGKWQNFEML